MLKMTMITDFVFKATDSLIRNDRVGLVSLGFNASATAMQGHIKAVK